MSITKSLSMFFLSFSPLWLSVFFIDGKSLMENSENIYTEIISISLILIGTLFSLVILIFAFNPKDRNGAQKYTLISAKEEKTITSEFLLSYILPLFAFDFTVWHETVLFLIFFAVFAYLCVHHNHFSVNIVLELLHYRFYSCEMENDDGQIVNKIIITQNTLPANIGSDICTRAINNDYCVQVNLDS